MLILYEQCCLLALFVLFSLKIMSYYLQLLKEMYNKNAKGCISGSLTYNLIQTDILSLKTQNVTMTSFQTSYSIDIYSNFAYVYMIYASLNT